MTAGREGGGEILTIRAVELVNRSLSIIFSSTNYPGGGVCLDGCFLAIRFFDTVDLGRYASL